MKKEIIRKLHELTPVEERQRKTGLFIEDMPAGALNMQEGHGRTLNNYFFRNREIYLSRHNRFAPYPLHRHTFLEINYMLRGSADQTVDGNLVHLDQGDLILLDVGTSHSISALGENDLRINILFRNTNISLDLLKELKGQGSVLFNFLLKEEDERKATRDFVVFRTDNNFRLRETLDDIIDEYFTNQQFSDLMLKSYLNILLAQLIRNYSVQIPEDGATKQLVVNMLSDITNEYATVSLKELSERYCYNRNYLSNIFKKEVGITFSEVLNRQRITEAHRLLVTTGLPISDIMGEVGITNKSFFYKKYEEMYKITPGKSRRNGGHDFF